MITSEQTLSIKQKAEIVQQMMQPGLQQAADYGELSQWASALAVYAGMIIGFIHARTGTPIGDDAKAAELLANNARTAMAVGRDNGL